MTYNKIKKKELLHMTAHAEGLKIELLCTSELEIDLFDKETWSKE